MIMRRIGDKYQLLIRRIILVVVDMISLLLSPSLETITRFFRLNLKSKF